MTTNDNPLTNSISFQFISFYFSFALALLVIGLVSVVIFQCALCCRSICMKWTCCKIKQSDSSFRHHMIIYVIFVLIGIFADNYQFYGNQYLTEGVLDVIDGLDILSGIFENFKDISDSIGVAGVGIQGVTENNTYCPSVVSDGFSGMKEIADLLVDASTGSSDMVGEFPGQMSSASQALSDYAIDQKDLFFFIFWAFIMVNLILLLLAALCKSKLSMRFMIIVAQILVICMTILCTVEMILVMLIGDYCMQPEDNLITAVRSLTDNKTTTGF